MVLNASKEHDQNPLSPTTTPTPWARLGIGHLHMLQCPGTRIQTNQKTVLLFALHPFGLDHTNPNHCHSREQRTWFEFHQQTLCLRVGSASSSSFMLFLGCRLVRVPRHFPRERKRNAKAESKCLCQATAGHAATWSPSLQSSSNRFSFSRRKSRLSMFFRPGTCRKQRHAKGTCLIGH